MSKCPQQHHRPFEPSPATLALLEHIQVGMQQLEESDGEYFSLFAMSIVRSVVTASGVVRAVDDLKRRLAGGDVQGAAATVELIEQWLNGIEARWETLGTKYVM